MKTKTISDLHTEHNEWLAKLDFYTDEIKIMTSRLNEIASKNNGKEILASVEHFQNQFIVQKENIDEIRHSIKDHENYIENRVEENPASSDQRQVHDHPKMRDTMNGFEKVFNELRQEFNGFLVKTM
jgi:hypothetical protein